MMRTPRRMLIWSAWLALLAAASVQAGIGLSLGSVQAEAWQAEDVRLAFGDGDAGAYQLTASVARLVLPGGLGDWRSLQLSCPVLTLVQGVYHCPQLRLSAETPQGAQQLQGELRFRDAQHWSVTLTGLRLAGGEWRVVGESAGEWRLSLQGQRVSLAALLELAAPGLPPWNWQGRLDTTLQLQGQGAAPASLLLESRLSGASWSDAEGLQAGQDLAGRLRLKAQRGTQGWQGELNADWRSGQVYADPVYLELDKHPLRLTASGRLPGDAGQLRLDAVALRLGELLQLGGRGRLPLAEPLQGELSLAAELPDLAALYPVLLQPFGYGGALGALEVAGSAQAGLQWRQGALAAGSLTLAALHVDDSSGRFGVSDASGQLHWQAAGEPPASHLRWQSGHLYRVDVAASRADFQLVGDRVALSAPLVLPMLEGRLRVPALQASGLAGGRPTWRTALQAEMLSLPALSRALGWPELAGQLSVEIPAVHYADRVLAMDGELVAHAFDGTVRVSGLQLHEPLGPAPVFEAEASLRGLDLERLTQVFDFGRITGRLDGDVRGLQLVGWEPTAFEAELRNPDRDDLPHRISQRAVENLTALGNNGAVALSGTFLRFFESFSYDRMLLKVRLAGQRAELDGLPHPGGGYYLVKGAGLPRIDVIGRNRDVAWRDLVERLRRIQLQGAQLR